MSIKGEIAKTASYLRSARKAILGRGGEISLTAGLKDLSEAIYKIPADASLAYQVDDSVAYRKIVPASAEEFAQVAKVGGMTRKCNNLIPFPYNYEAGYSVTKSGVTITVQADGGISVVGTATANVVFPFVIYSDEDVLKLQQGKQYAIGGGGNVAYVTAHITPLEGEIKSTAWLDTGASSTTARALPEGYRLYRFCVYVANGKTVNEVVYPMLVEGSEVPTKYEQYYEGLRDTAVSELKSEGANKFNIHASVSSPSSSGTFTLIDDNTFTVATIRTMESGWYFATLENILIPKGANNVYISYTATPNGSVTKPRLYVKYVDNGQELVTTNIFDGAGEQKHSFSIPDEYKSGKAYLRLNWYACAGEKCNAGDYIEYENVMVSFDADAPYKPYRGTIDTFEISEELRTFLADKGYGRGVEGYPNYIDYERKVFIPNTYRKVFDGTENWVNSAIADGTSKRHLYALENIAVATDTNLVSSIISNHYNTVSASALWKGAEGISLSTTGANIFLYDAAHNADTSTEWKAHLAELYANGNPLIVEYALAEPIETDISAYLGNDSFIEVEGGGTIKAVNEYQYDTPSTINYIYKTVGE